MISFELAAIFARLQAPGMPQTLRKGSRWQSFLRTCANERSASASMPDPLGGPNSAAFGLTDDAGLASVVFVDGARELQTAYESVERELVSRREAENRLRDAEGRKDEFLAMLAHELRNPLAPISMAAQILKIGPANPARLKQTCQIIERQVTHMTSLLNDLLDVSRVTGGMVTLAQELLDMRQIVDHALAQARPLIHARQHHLTLNLAEHGACVMGDATRLVQIVTNLLNNAAKYTPPAARR